MTRTYSALIGLASIVPLAIVAWLISRIFIDDKEGSPGAVSTMGTARWKHTATLLPNGKVLIVGGLSRVANAIMPVSLSSTEIYDPSSNSWSPSGVLAVARASHTATLLPSGKVLVVGGQGNSGTLSDAELYDPASGTWSPAGTMPQARSSHTATLLPSGKVLVAGGSAHSDTAELYEPSTNTWSSAGRMLSSQRYYTAALLPSGNVIVLGSLGTPELYQPSSDVWSSASAARFWPWPELQEQTATLLPTGKVLVAGGGTFRNASPTPSTFLYDPSSSTWSSTGNMASSRKGHTATLLPNARVLVAGGISFRLNSSAELYDPFRGTWSQAGRLAKARVYHTATLLPGGKVLFAGGQGNSGPLSSAELYDPSQPVQTP